nr:unnamed protein product [Spirometra erinaceieuropaei]
MLEGREFTISTDYKPLNSALQSQSDKVNPWKIHKLHYIIQFTSDIRHINGSRNELADALRRPFIAHLQLCPEIDFAEMVKEKRRISPLYNEDGSGLQLQDLTVTTGSGAIPCDVSIVYHRSFVSHPFSAKFFPPYVTNVTLRPKQLRSWFPTTLSGLGCTKT